MRLLHAVGCLVLGLVLCMASDQAQGGGKDKDKGKETPKDLVVGKVKKVDIDKNKFTIVLESGKDRTFGVDDKTKFFGPKGGKAKDGLKDDRMAKGNEVKVLPTKDGKTAKEVHLPYRKKSTDKADKK
jgi:hypothetical protein